MDNKIQVSAKAFELAALVLGHIGFGGFANPGGALNLD